MCTVRSKVARKESAQVDMLSRQYVKSWHFRLTCTCVVLPVDTDTGAPEDSSSFIYNIFTCTESNSCRTLQLHVRVKLCTTQYKLGLELEVTKLLAQALARTRSSCQTYHHPKGGHVEFHGKYPTGFWHNIPLVLPATARIRFCIRNPAAQNKHKFLLRSDE